MLETRQRADDIGILTVFLPPECDRVSFDAGILAAKDARKNVRSNLNRVSQRCYEIGRPIPAAEVLRVLETFELCINDLQCLFNSTIPQPILIGYSFR